MKHQLQSGNNAQQLMIDWTAAVAVPAAKPPDVPPRPPAIPSIDPLLPVQVLPWDFRTTFPPVLPDAIDAGVIAEEDALPENLAALHDEHARELLMALSDLDAVHDARCRGVDPITGKAPRTDEKKRELPGRLDRELQRIESWWQTLLDTYEAVFGTEAADAFGKCIRARHAGIEVRTNAWPLPHRHETQVMPIPKPLRRAVKAGVFGKDEDGPIDPSPEEVLDITEHHAEVLTELVKEFRGAVQSPPVQEALQKYADDFGRKAVGGLLAYCRRQAVLHGPHP